MAIRKVKKTRTIRKNSHRVKKVKRTKRVGG